MRAPLATGITVIVLAAWGCGDDEDLEPREGLVSTQWLADHLDAPDVVVLDARPTDEYLAGHLPGAVSASFPPGEHVSHGTPVSYGGGLDLFGDHDAPVPFQDGPPDQIRQAARDLGIRQDSHVVVYDAGAAFHAARLWFTLRLHGAARVQILDGGFLKWVDEGRPVTTDVPSVARGNFTPTDPDETMLATTDGVLEAQPEPDVHLHSGLLPSWHYGGHLAYSRAGHIPGTVNIPLGHFFRADGTWRDADAIVPLFEVMGIHEGDEVITYCGGSPLAACTYFTLQVVLGYEHVRNYMGAMVTWLDDPRDLPLHTYDHPELLRDTNWIHWWAGERIQTLLLDPPARVIDVRSAEDHDDAHIPWSVNVPLNQDGDVTGMEPDEWADALGAVGIDRDIEAVVCDETITARAAAMFWLLEHLGHPRVSVCADGVEGWAEAYGLTDEPTIIADPQVPLDVAVHPRTFDPEVDDAPILRGTDDPPVDDRFPRQWVVATNEVPETIPVDVHPEVPAETHLTAEGSMRDAYELWMLYEDAGVSRFSEVVVAAETLGEASLGYLALRLIGFPMVRVRIPEGTPWGD